MFNKKKKAKDAQPAKKFFFTSQAPTQALHRNNETVKKDFSIDDRFTAVADTSLIGKGTPIVLHAKLTMDEYRQMLGDDFKKSATPENNELKVESKFKERTKTDSTGKKIQQISITQGQMPTLFNPAALKARHINRMIANVVTDENDQKQLAIPVKKIQFLINGKVTDASTLKQMLPNGEMNTFKLDGTSINIDPAKDLSGETAPVRLVVTTVNGERHAVKYTAIVIKPEISYQSADKTAYLSFKAGDQSRTFAEVGAKQAFFTKDGNDTTVVNMTANGQTVAEAQIEPATGKIKLIPLSNYTGQLDLMAVPVYLDGNEKLMVEYQPAINS